MNNDSSKQNYRLYGFAPYQLTGIQAGIQFGHAAVELMLKYRYDNIIDMQTKLRNAVSTWATQDKTFIILNGGSLTYLQTLYNEFEDEFGGFSGRYPYACFNEPDLGGMISSFVFLVPESDWGFYESDKWEDYVNQDASSLIRRTKPEVPPMRLFLDKFKLHGGY
jgi:hypothetical protein